MNNILNTSGKKSTAKSQSNTLAPDFTATDSTGKTLRLSDFHGKKNVVLVFNRGFM